MITLHIRDIILSSFFVGLFFDGLIDCQNIDFHFWINVVGLCLNSYITWNLWKKIETFLEVK